MNKTRKDVVETVTASIVAALEKGVAPWVRPWQSTGPAPVMGMPRNASTGRAYRGMNVVILMAAAMERGYSDARWLTFNQARSMGGSVRKGEKGTEVVLWKTYETKDEDETTGAEKSRRRVFARSFYVFNVAQCDIPGLTAPEPVVAPVVERHAAIDAAVAKLGVDVRFGGNRAFYSIDLDRVQLPEPASFESPAAYYATLLHEVGHWTGHKSRLARTFGKRFGDLAYAQEELVAEMSAAFLCAAFGVAGKLQHAEYIGSWVKIMKADKYAVFTAAKEAQRVLDLVMGAEAQESEEVADVA